MTTDEKLRIIHRWTHDCEVMRTKSGTGRVYGRIRFSPSGFVQDHTPWCNNEKEAIHCAYDMVLEEIWYIVMNISQCERLR